MISSASLNVCIELCPASCAPKTGLLKNDALTTIPLTQAGRAETALDDRRPPSPADGREPGQARFAVGSAQFLQEVG